MEKLKKLKAEHNHLFTDLLKASIFGLVMLAPLIAVASKCLYVTCNKNAKESYYGENINNETYQAINNPDLLVFNDTYYFNSNDYTNITNKDFYGSQYKVLISNFELIQTTSELNFDTNLISSFATYKVVTNNNYYLQFFDENNNSLYNQLNTNNAIRFKFTYLGNSLNPNGNLMLYTNIISKVHYNKNSYLDNAFYYAVDELGQQQLFSWTKNTAMYTTINTMTSGLDINGGNNTLAILLTYWALITIVYVIFDIVIQVFVKLTHFITE